MKQLNSINSHYNINGLLCLATACILAAIMYFLTVIGYLKKKHHEVLCLSFIDNSNNYIIALEIVYTVTKEIILENEPIQKAKKMTGNHQCC